MPPSLLVFLLAAQTHSYSPSDIEEGARRYRISCIVCHGPEGAAIAGIDLGRGKFKRASSDDDLVKVIINGVPGTGMPPTTMGPSRALMIVAYLRTMHQAPAGRPPSIAAPSGDPARGQLLFDAPPGNCRSCHRLRGAGGRSGPDLSDAGLYLRPLEIEHSLLEPQAAHSLATPPYRATFRDGSSVRGFLLNQDSSSFQILDDQGELRSLPRSELRDSGPIPSWMPSFRDKLNPQQLADLIAFLSRQKGVQ